METPVTASLWCARMMEDVLTENQDINIVFDSAKSYRFGPVGAGKTAKAMMISRVLDPVSPLRDVLIPVDEIRAFDRVVGARRRHAVIWLDEAGWWVGKEFASNRHVKRFRAELQTDRKLGQARMFCTGSIWALTTPFSEWGRVTWRYKSLDRTTAELYVWNGHVEPAADEYGQFVATHEKIPPPPKEPWTEYEELVLGHVHQEEECISLI